MRMNVNLNLKDTLLQDFWVHFAGVIVIIFGIIDLWYFKQLSHDTDLLFLIGGIAGMGLKIANGTTAQLRRVAADTAYSGLRTAQAAEAVITGIPVTPSTPPVAVVAVVPPPIPPVQP